MSSRGSKIGITVFIVLLLAAVGGYFAYTKMIEPSQNRTKADELRDEGKFAQADAAYAKLEQTNEIKEIRRDLFYESRVLHCADMLKKSLLRPESLVLREAGIGELLDQHEPSVVLHYTAQTSGGYTVDYYLYFSWEDYDYKMGTSVTTLDSDRIPSYLSKDERLQWMHDQIMIKYVSFSKILDNDELNEISNLLSHGSYNTGIVGYSDVVPMPTPRPTKAPESEIDD